MNDLLPAVMTHRTATVRVAWGLAPGVSSLITDAAGWLESVARRTDLLAAALDYGLDNLAVTAALTTEHNETKRYAA